MPRKGVVVPTPNPPLTHWERMVIFILRFLYDLCFVLVMVVCSPYFLFRMLTTSRFRAGLLQRLGFVDRRTGDRDCLWVHGVSVGEIKAARPLVETFHHRNPEIEIVISSTTEEGHHLAQKLFPDFRTVFFPLDFSPITRKVFRRLRPNWVVLVELEIWPNFLLEARKRRIPVFVVNGRLSEKSFKGYRRLGRFLPQFPWVDLYSVQTEQYAERFVRLGVPKQRIQVSGNLKFDEVNAGGKQFTEEEVQRWFPRHQGERWIVGGSTHEPEESQLWDVFQRLEAEGKESLQLVLAPRHPTRVAGVEESLRREGARPVRLTRIREENRPLDSGEVLIVDTIGELEKFYSLAHVVFVGGSLIPRGGHNVLEPAALGKPVMVGPHTFNFLAEVDLLVESGALVQATGLQDLESKLKQWLFSPLDAKRCGQAGAEIIKSNQGATLRTVEAVEWRLYKH